LIIGFDYFIIIHSRNDGNEVGGSVYQRLSNRLETGVQLAWTTGTNQTRFALASKYQLDAQTALGVKVNNICQLGLSFQQLLRPGMSSFLFRNIKNRFYNYSRREINSIGFIRSTKFKCRWTQSRLRT